MEYFNSASPFTIPTNTRKFAASAAYILNVAHFVDSPTTSACHFRSFFDKSCVVAAEPNIFTASVSTYHPVLPLLVPCCFPAVSSVVVSFPPPIPFPPPTSLFSIRFPPISTFCSSCDFAPALGVLPFSGNVVACFVNLPVAPLVIPSMLWANVGSFCFPGRDFP